ncbi:hypothetical protein QVD17_32171 [Tagetes erecta]|uniref:VQ domain-containing protein n=1 Tax=Tagetes erecta TaxID=13708 RepID=A0AAD8KBB0_TARER|nr:hypothetical protein QVD17_32171 [Tagetes erecta]
MTKRLMTTQPTFKISKKQHTHQFNSLIKALKPKVFITSSCNFKTLVQELTGNGSHHVVSPEATHVIHIDDHDSPSPSLDPTLGSSPHPSLDNMFMPFDYDTRSSEELEWQMLEDPVMNNVNFEIELANIESWLLDLEPPL